VGQFYVSVLCFGDVRSLSGIVSFMFGDGLIHMSLHEGWKCLVWLTKLSRWCVEGVLSFSCECHTFLGIL
jgi:hypothetical protein